jgi:glycosyltransferase involved in cell wall biosynthesis
MRENRANGGFVLRVLITVNCHGVDASAQGGLDLGGMLSERGHAILMQVMPGSPVEEACRTAGLETAGPGLRGASFARGIPGFRRLLQRFQPDVVCATRADGQTAVALVAPGTPLVRIRCDIRKPGSGRSWRLVDGRTDLVVLPAPFMVARGYQGQREGPVTVIPNPVDTARFHPADRTADGVRPLLVSLARLSPVKGHRTLIRSLTLLPEEVHAVIAGPPSQQSPEELAAFASDLGVGHRLSLPGRIEQPEEFLRQGGIGVITSLGSEVVSRAGMEMMSCGLPVLAAATNGLCDLIDDGLTGLLHSPGNHRQLAAQAEFLLRNPSAAHRMGGRARRYCLEHLSRGVVGRLWEETLCALADGEQPPDSRVPRKDTARREGR